MKLNVLVTSYYDPAAIQPALDRLSPVANVHRAEPSAMATERNFINALRGMQIAIVSAEPCTESVFLASPDLKLIACDGVGYDHIDVSAATRQGIVVTNAPMVHESNGDFVMGMIIALVRKLLIADAGVRSGKWHDRQRYVSRDICGSTLGLLGFGRVARAVATRARGFGMPVLAYSPHADQKTAGELGVKIVGFEQLLAEADILSLHVPLNDQTRGMIGARELALMKVGAYLVNSSRGAVIDEESLVAALKSNRLAGAALDVFCDEPPPLDHPLLLLQNVILSPHVGSDTYGAFSRVFDCIVDDVLLFLSGKPPRNVLNPDALSAPGAAR